MSYNSKYTGQQVESLLDQVAQSGDTESSVYVVEFPLSQLEWLAGGWDGVLSYNEARLINAIQNNKVICIPIDSSDSEISGVVVATAWVEDMIYMNVIHLGQIYNIALDLGVGEINSGHVEVTSLATKDDIANSGGSGGGSTAYPIVYHSTSDSNVTLSPNTFHVWNDVAGYLDLELGPEQSGVANEYLFQVKCGMSTSISLPADITWANENNVILRNGFIVQISILNKIASWIYSRWEGESSIEPA